ncbi:DNA double-strand break repair nuclease NurA [Novipirellula sp.]|uniref:DNA double-strand break repair nuclease NurA n=1 Tax=Novipirellula sp. TaxID=2795430 RepID=UPI003564E79E
MPYENQLGSKTSHSDVVRNPEVQAFLKRCEPFKEPSEDELKSLTDLFASPDYTENPPAVRHVIASDGSFYHSSIDDRFPSVQVSYLKFSTILIEMADFDGLEDSETHLVDPFRVATLQRNRDTLTLVLPLSNFRLPTDKSVRETFRRQTEEFLRSPATRFRETDDSTSLLRTLAELALLREDPNAPTNHIRVHRCPDDECESRDIYLDLGQTKWQCAGCGGELFISDCLRIWEGITDLHAKQEPASRFMSYLEHLLPVHYARYLSRESPTGLAGLALMIDGPLAVFGNAAWLHSSIMRFYSRLRTQCRANNQLGPIVVGLQKTGYVVDFMNRLAPHIQGDKLFSITDEFRYEHLGVQRSGNGFGSETYYGHDFAFKTSSGKMFIFALPYPFEAKSASPDFATLKSERDRYPELTRAVALINEVSTDLYRDAVIPIALAHRHAAISLKPGGRVLDIMGRETRGAR